VLENNSVTVSGDGGAILNGSYSYGNVVNSTFNGNSAGGSHGGAIADDFGCSGTSFINVHNSILWGDSSNELEASFIGDSPGGGIFVDYSDVQGGVPSSDNINSGTGNINQDPLFTSGLHLQSAPDLSPAINAGNNPDAAGITTDLDGNARVVGGVVDMGAYEVQSKIIFVDSASHGLNNGTNWTNAYTSLQSGLAAATSGNIILVGQGTYKPTTTTSRTATFQLKNGVPIYGGYNGVDTSDPDQRGFVSILSGNIGSTSLTSDNSYHVVTGSGTNTVRFTK